jgi:methyl-accepting chemotaxis protein/methyl-accepting chemotaxis protein-1 (serine sensor receptor)
MKTQVTIGTKLIGSFAGLLGLTLLLGYFSLSSIGNLAEELQTSSNVTVKKLELASRIDTLEQEMRVHQRGLVMFALMKEPGKVEQAKADFHAAAAKLQSLISEIRPLIHVERGRQALDAIQTGLDAWMPLFDQNAQLCVSQNIDTAQIAGITDKIVLNAAEIARNAGVLAQLQTDVFAASSASGLAMASRGRWTVLIVIGLLLAVGASVFVIVRQINGTLRRVAMDMADGAAQVAGAAGQVSSSSQALAQGASEQAASIEETSASTEELNSMTRHSADNARLAADHMAETARVVGDANRTLEEMIASMREINNSSGKIAKIIKVIDEIAFQTNILALNAAVEAARAGEAGMGFAVVADEVRNLAQRSAQAAKDTAALIEESISKSSEGGAKLDRVTQAIHAITGSTEEVKKLVEEVKVGSEEQARGIDQIARAVTQMEQVTQKNAASAEESASAGEEMSSQAGTLDEIAHGLQAMVGGGESRSRVPTGAAKHPKAAARKRAAAIADPFEV